MENATLRQAAHILRIVEEKGTPKDQLQDLIRTGLLADLLDANISGVNRDEFRRVIGLKPLSLCHVPNVFFRNRYGLYIWGDFRSLVVAKAESIATIPPFKHIELPRDMNDAEIENMLGDGHLFTETEVCAIVADLVSKQEGGKEGGLLNNGRASLFYLASCVVVVAWSTDSREWGVDTYERDGIRWIAGRRAFSPATEV